MMRLIDSRPGRVSVLTIGALRGLAYLDITPALLSDDKTLIITSISLEQMVNAQFQKTLQDTIYVYPFGDLMGDIIISGYAVMSKAGSSSSDGCRDSFSANSLLTYYEKNKLSVNPDPIRIKFGNRVIEGFLVGCKLTNTQADTSLYQFMLSLKSANFGDNQTAKSNQPLPI